MAQRDMGFTLTLRPSRVFPYVRINPAVFSPTAQYQSHRAASPAFPATARDQSWLTSWDEAAKDLKSAKA